MLPGPDREHTATDLAEGLSITALSVPPLSHKELHVGTSAHDHVSTLSDSVAVTPAAGKGLLWQLHLRSG